jgi:hypothetical protein
MSEIKKLVESLKSSGPSFNEDGVPVGKFPNYKESWAAAFIIEQLQYRLEEEKELCNKAVEMLKDSTGLIKLRQNQEKIKEVIGKYEKARERD